MRWKSTLWLWIIPYISPKKSFLLCFLKILHKGFTGSPVVKILSFHCREHGSVFHGERHSQKKKKNSIRKMSASSSHRIKWLRTLNSGGSIRHTFQSWRQHKIKIFLVEKKRVFIASTPSHTKKLNQVLHGEENRFQRKHWKVGNNEEYRKV